MMFLFGKVSVKRQIYLSIMTFVLVVWLFVTLGIAVLRFAVFMLVFVIFLFWFNDNWIRLVMLAAAVAIPPVIGVFSIVMVDFVDWLKMLRGRVLCVFKGYPYT